MKEKTIAFIEQRLEYTDRLDTIREKLSVMDQCFGVVAFAYDLLIAEEKESKRSKLKNFGTKFTNQDSKKKFMAKSYILCKLPIDRQRDICYNVVTTEKGC